jgi:hypothetical protein
MAKQKHKQRKTTNQPRRTEDQKKARNKKKTLKPSEARVTRDRVRHPTVEDVQNVRIVIRNRDAPSPNYPGLAEEDNVIRSVCYLTK